MKAPFFLLLTAAIISKGALGISTISSTNRQGDRPDTAVVEATDAVAPAINEDAGSDRAANGVAAADNNVLFQRGKTYEYSYRAVSTVQGDPTAAHRPNVDVRGGGLRIHATATVRVVGAGDAPGSPRARPPASRSWALPVVPEIVTIPVRPVAGQWPDHMLFIIERNALSFFLAFLFVLFLRRQGHDGFLHRPTSSLNSLGR